MEEMKLWAELTMSVQKEETKSSTDSDDAFTSALCKAAGTWRHLNPPPPSNNTMQEHGCAEPSAPPEPHSHTPQPPGAPLGRTPPPGPIPPCPPGPVLPQQLRAFLLAVSPCPGFLAVVAVCYF